MIAGKEKRPMLMFNKNIQSLLVMHTTTEYRKRLFDNARYMMGIEFGKMDDQSYDYIMDYVKGRKELKDVKEGLLRRFRQEKNPEKSMALWDNKLNIYTMPKLRRAIIALGCVNMMFMDFEPHYSFNYNTLKEMHNNIFGDIFPWAGDERSVALERKIDFLDGRKLTFLEFDEIEPNVKRVMEQMEELHIMGKIDEAMREVFRVLNNNTAEWKSMEDESKAGKLADALGQLWFIHPFIEGNTTAILYMGVKFAEKNEFPLDRKTFYEMHLAYDVRKGLFLSSLPKGDSSRDVDFLALLLSVAIIEGTNVIKSKVIPSNERIPLHIQIEEAQKELEASNSSGEQDTDD